MSELTVLGARHLPSRARMTEEPGEVSCRLPLLLEDSTTSDWHVLRLACQSKGGKEGLCVFVGVLRDFGILTVTFYHYSKPV